MKVTLTSVVPSEGNIGSAEETELDDVAEPLHQASQSLVSLCFAFYQPVMFQC